MPPAMGLPSISRRRRTIWPGVAESESDCAVPETGASEAYSGRAPITVKLAQFVVPFTQATEVDCWPSESGPIVRSCVAMPFALAIAAGPCTEMLDAARHTTDWPLIGVPLLRTRACTGQVMVAPAARETNGVSALRTGAEPPVKCD